ncbi:MAG: hypothetical protein QOD29_4572, partial [Alphaproteobacteria bacterium]|nr:hypothetical protein [Alphaproteobacteria bacterium]
MAQADNPGARAEALGMGDLEPGLQRARARPEGRARVAGI